MKKLLTGLLLASSFSAASAELVCGGTVDVLAYHANNKLMLKLSNMNVPVFFCSPDSEWVVAGTPYKTGPQTCQTLYSTFLAAKLAGKSLSSVYFDGEQVPASCNSWGNWSVANIRYFVIN
jgi:hypothetical protein